MKKIALLTALMLSVSACGMGVKSQSGAMAPEKQSGGLLGLSEKSDVEVETPKAFAGKNEVVIGTFKVAFTTYTKANKTAKGGFLEARSMGGRSSAALFLEGIDDADMQAITDKAYADFVSTLKANGYTVRERSGLENNKHYSKISTLPSPQHKEGNFFSQSKDKLTIVAPKGMPFYYNAGEAGESGGFGFSNPGNAYATYAEESGVPVISVFYTVDFANSGGYGGYRSWSSLEVGQGMSVRPGSGIQLVGGQMSSFSNNVGSAKLGQAVFEPDTFGEMEETTSDMEKVGQVASNVLTFAMGQGTNGFKEFTVKADPAKYKQVANKVLAETNEKLVKTMANNR